MKLFRMGNSNRLCPLAGDWRAIQHPPRLPDRSAARISIFRQNLQRRFLSDRGSLSAGNLVRRKNREEIGAAKRRKEREKLYAATVPRGGTDNVAWDRGEASEASGDASPGWRRRTSRPSDRRGDWPAVCQGYIGPRRRPHPFGLGGAAAGGSVVRSADAILALCT